MSTKPAAGQSHEAPLASIAKDVPPSKFKGIEDVCCLAGHNDLVHMRSTALSVRTGPDGNLRIGIKSRRFFEPMKRAQIDAT
jgi:hypothetical protein